MKTIMAAMALLATACAQKAPDPKDVARIEGADRISRETAAEQTRRTPQQQGEIDRQVATAQLRAKLGAKPTAGVAIQDRQTGMGRDVFTKRFQDMRAKAERNRKAKRPEKPQR